MPKRDASGVSLDPLGNPPILQSYLYGANWREFARAHDTYSSWALLVAEQGSFRFRLGTQEWQEVTFGAWVVCPPHTELARQVIDAPLSAHFLRFTWTDPLFTLPSFAAHQSTRQHGRLKENLVQWRSLRCQSLHTAHQWREHILWDVLALGWSEQQLCHEDARSPLMQIARELIGTNIEKGRSLAEVAAELNLSPVALTRQFRAAFGLTPSQFLLNQRLERARQLLISTDWPLDEVAVHCGFGSSFYLSRVWSKQFGQSPSRFRRENQI